MKIETPKKMLFTYRRKNVITKVVIPRLKTTIKYILSELEEKEREETFRLKRFKQLKNKGSKQDSTPLHICCCCLSMFASEEDITESTCPVCLQAAKAKGMQSQVRLNVVPCKSAENKGKENKKHLEHLMSHIDDVIDLTRQYTEEGILSASMEKFLRTCNQVKEKIEDYANAPPLCDVCKKVLEHTGNKIILSSKKPSSKSIDLPGPDTQTKDRPCGGPEPCSDSTFNISPETEDKLGYFEKKFKEIVKVTRLQNDDGSISEEKQVITIRTERRNPRKTAFDNRNNNDKFGPGGGNDNGGGKHYGRGNDYGGGNDYGETKDYAGDGGPNHRNIGRRETKSEHSCRTHQMGEPTLRSCMSSSQPKSTMNRDASTNFDGGSCVSDKSSKVTLPPEFSTANTKSCSALPKVTQSSSFDSHICCPKKAASVCDSQLGSAATSQVSVANPKNVSKSVSAQTCCKDVPVKMPTEDKGTCCLPTCKGNDVCPDNKGSKTKAISTDAVWRDASTSTTGLTEVPSQMPSKKVSPTPSCTSKGSSGSDSGKKRRKSKSDGCCTIKILAKPKVCCFDELEKKPEPKAEEKEVILKGSMYETLKSIFLPPTTSTESCKVEQKPPDIKSICKSCLSKLNSFAPSTKSSMKSQGSPKSQSSSCKMCQANTESDREIEIQSCPSCGSLAARSSCGSSSCKSMGVGSSEKSLSSESHTCQKSPTPSIHSQKHTCCLAKKGSDDEEDDNTCCAMAQTMSNKSSKTICCSKKKTSSVCCPSKGSSPSVKSKGSATSIKSAGTGSCFDKKDAMTCTKRSARYDVRPLRKKYTCEKISVGACTCKSDSQIVKGRGLNRPVKRCSSFYEDDYYFFRW